MSGTATGIGQPAAGAAVQTQSAGVQNGIGNSSKLQQKARTNRCGLLKIIRCKIAELIAKILESYAFHTAKMVAKDTVFVLLHAEFFKYRCQNLFYRAFL
jgi:hypothetical protein